MFNDVFKETGDVAGYTAEQLKKSNFEWAIMRQFGAGALQMNKVEGAGLGAIGFQAPTVTNALGREQVMFGPDALRPLGVLPKDLSELDSGLANIDEQLRRVGAGFQQATEFGMAFAAGMQELVVGSLMSLGNAIVSIFSGEGIGKTTAEFFGEILKMVGTFLIKLGTSAIAASGVFEAFKSMDPTGGILAGAAAIVLGISLKGVGSWLSKLGGSKSKDGGGMRYPYTSSININPNKTMVEPESPYSESKGVQTYEFRLIPAKTPSGAIDFGLREEKRRLNRQGVSIV